MGAIPLNLAAGGMQYMGIEADTKAQSNYYSYLAGTAETNAGLVEAAGAANAHAVQDAAAAQFAQNRRELKQLEGAQTAAMAANGIAGTVTAEDIARDTRKRADLDEAAIRFNADSKADEIVRNASFQAFDLRNQAAGYRMAQRNVESAGKYKRWASLLSTAATTANSASSAIWGG